MCGLARIEAERAGTTDRARNEGRGCARGGRVRAWLPERRVHPVPHVNFQRIPASLAIRFETLLPVINPAGNPPPGEIHWPTI
ncbi:MAG: hypothetical protein H6Q86_4598 [candidate division NC10 bacterium]|nr:hypothetical protein [candidate division NC10 bacterium]